MVLVIVEQPSPSAPLSNIEFHVPTINEVDDQSQPMVMSTSFICQQIDMGINDLMYQMLRQLVEIIKLMIQNEMYNMHE